MNSRQFAIVAGFTFFVGMVWLVTDIIFNTKASIPISDKLQVLMEPVDPNFNTRILDIINAETLDSSEVVVSEPDSFPFISPPPSINQGLDNASPLATPSGSTDL